MPNITNGAFSTLASGIASNATSLTLRSGTGSRFPSSDFYLCIYDGRYPNWAVAKAAGKGEIVLVATRTSDTCNPITRAQDDTTALDFNTTGVTYKAELNVVAANLTTIRYNLYSSFKEAGANAGDEVASDVEWTETAGTVKYKVKTQYVHKTGNRQIRVTALAKAGTSETAVITLNVNGTTDTVTTTSATYEKVTKTLSVISLTDGTIYDVKVGLSANAVVETAYLKNIVIDVEY